MGNEFINYLNSMNNANGDNINALAEAQVTNKYYSSIRVDRKLGKFIQNKISNGEHKSYIITGHAGDGKTSILVQILKDLNLLAEGESLKVEDVKSRDNIKVMYVKDMSELSEQQQLNLLKKSLDAPKIKASAVLISNTGPLIKSFVNLLGSSEQLKDEIEDTLLKQLDSNKCEEIDICGKKFYLINIARIENIGFVSEIINKICDDKLWIECKECSKNELCPMYFNRKCVLENKERVISFIEMYYRWLQENDKRITIRQMLSQISFAFTGNISCENITKYYNNKYAKFNLNFANLFFGYRGIQKIDDSNQIKGIDLIEHLELDDCAFEEDYEIFVKENFNYFNDSIGEEIKGIWSQYSNQINNIDENEESEIIDKQHAIRRAIRRFFLMYGLSEDNKALNKLYNQIYGQVFSQYINATTEIMSKRELKKFTKIIYQALYIKNIGVPPTTNNDLYLTLTRNDGSFQSVLLLLAKANEKDLEVKQVSKNVEIEDVERCYVLKLKIRGNDEFKLTLPLMMYFYSVVNGEINTEINPALSHGLAELNAKLIKNFREDNDEGVLSLIVNTNNGARKVNIEINEDCLYFDS
ncbi:hypothetical protein [Clostridium celatum]|uniref:hypothetical protein n=1 Tax=Clostridium celatum TaxID=36834 RepID=UPI00189746FE|nr:hypothetical protein [Clostridium celatum]